MRDVEIAQRIFQIAQTGKSRNILGYGCMSRDETLFTYANSEGFAS